MNNALHGYNLLSQPSRSAAGDVAFYTGKSLNAVKRTDLSVTDIGVRAGGARGAAAPQSLGNSDFLGSKRKFG